MDKIVIGILIVISLMGGWFWAYNNDDGIGDGIDDGARTLGHKIEQFDYSGTVAPGSGHRNELEDNQAD